MQNVDQKNVKQDGIVTNATAKADAQVNKELTATEKHIVDLTHTGAQKAERIKDHTKGMLYRKADQGREKLAATLNAQAETLSKKTDQLSRDGYPSQARLIGTVHTQVSKVGMYLKNMELDQIINDIEDFAHAKPWRLAISAFGIGKMYGRFRK